MSGTVPARLQTLLSGEFDRQGWEWDPVEAGGIVESIVVRGTVDAGRLAASVSSTYLQRIGATRSDMADAIKRAVGGHIPAPDEGATVTLVPQDNRQYHLNVGPGAQITDANLNVGGTQINVRADGCKKEILAGVAALVRAGLRGDWNPDAARQVEVVVDRRHDITLEDVEEVTANVVREEAGTQRRAREFREKVLASGLGGALSHGIISAVGQALAWLPV